MKTILLTLPFAAILSATPAAAGCLHNGITYSAGSTICSEGWMQECTVADYWSAIGFCKAGDAPKTDQMSKAASGKASVEKGRASNSVVKSKKK